MTTDTYATEQIDRMTTLELDEPDFYRIQIRSNVADAHTKWMNISPAELAAFRAVLAERV
jgi:hypothetical protein